MRTHGTYAPRSLELRQLARWASRIFWIAIMYLAPVGAMIQGGATPLQAFGYVFAGYALCVLLVASLMSALELDG